MEVWFQPSLIYQCDVEFRKDLYANVVLSSNTTIFQETRTIDSAGSEGLVGMKVDSVKFQVVLFVFHVPGDRGTVFSTIQVQAQLDPYW